jgi:endonuclease YncB( thermonuclease family)
MSAKVPNERPEGLIKPLNPAPRPDLLWRESVRLRGVDAPELSMGEPGKKARDALLSRVRGAKAIDFKPALRNGRARRDKYGRLLG